VNGERCVVAVDGPGGSGKSTVSRRLAARLGARYLDTGAMYRAVTWAVLQAGVDPHDADAVGKVAREAELCITTEPVPATVVINGVDVTGDIRGPEVTGEVSAVSAVPEVRRILVARQKEIIAAAQRIVVEGRDIAAVVAPDADLKVFLTASAAERARRRSREHGADPAAVAAALDRRDLLDSTRRVDPLQPAPDAVVLDTTDLGIEEVVERLLEMLRARGRA